MLTCACRPVNRPARTATPYPAACRTPPRSRFSPWTTGWASPSPRGARDHSLRTADGSQLPQTQTSSPELQWGVW